MFYLRPKKLSIMFFLPLCVFLPLLNSAIYYLFIHSKCIQTKNWFTRLIYIKYKKEESWKFSFSSFHWLSSEGGMEFCLHNDDERKSMNAKVKKRKNNKNPSNGGTNILLFLWLNLCVYSLMALFLLQITE